MTDSPITLTAFASMKGGVGKTTLAVGHARQLARQGRRPVFVDLDWTGTSVADALHLNIEAPLLEPTEIGGLKWHESPQAYVSGDALLRLRIKRRDGYPERWLPYFNDWLILNEGRGDPIAYLWKGVGAMADNVRYLPSSALFRDVGTAVGLLKEEARVTRWEASLRVALNALIDHGATDLVIDLPPGLSGFAEILLGALHRADGLLARAHQKKAWLIATPERAALLPTLEFYWRTRRRYPHFHLLGNRVRSGHTSFGRTCKALAREAGLSPTQPNLVEEHEGMADLLSRGVLPPMEIS